VAGDKDGKPYHVGRMEVASDWPRIRAIDWGYVKPGWCGLVCHVPGRAAYLEQEYLFSHTTVTEVAETVKTLTDARGIRRALYCRGHVDVDAELGLRGDNGRDVCTVGRAADSGDKDRVNGWQALRHWLREAPDGLPWLVISPIALRHSYPPAMISDEHKPEDIDTDGTITRRIAAGTSP